MPIIRKFFFNGLLDNLTWRLWYFCRVCCAEITEDSSMLAVGFNDSIIKVFTLVPQKLKTMKSADKLQEVNIEAEDVLVGSLRVFVSFLNCSLKLKVALILVIITPWGDFKFQGMIINLTLNVCFFGVKNHMFIMFEGRYVTSFDSCWIFWNVHSHLKWRQTASIITKKIYMQMFFTCFMTL